MKKKGPPKLEETPFLECFCHKRYFPRTGVSMPRNHWRDSISCWKTVNFPDPVFEKYPNLTETGSPLSRNHYIIPFCCPCALFGIESKLVCVSVLRIGIVYCFFQIFSFGTWFLIMHMGESSNLTVILTPRRLPPKGPVQLRPPAPSTREGPPEHPRGNNKKKHETAKTPCTTSLTLPNKFSPKTSWYEQMAPPEPGTPHPRTETRAKPRK